LKQLFTPIKFIFNLIIILFIYVIFPRLFHILFQNKHYKLKKYLTTEDLKNIHLDWQQHAQKFQVSADYRNEYQDVLTYFQRFDTIAIFDKNKQNPQYKNLKFVFHILDLAKEAITHLDEVTKDNKKLAYYESSKNASLNSLIEHFTKKLTAKNENKISTKQAKKEVKIKRFIAKYLYTIEQAIKEHIKLATRAEMNDVLVDEQFYCEVLTARDKVCKGDLRGLYSQNKGLASESAVGGV